jgi:NAD(P)-dependent dehydrogenase (short-subunit alcohol dehydrogenase family)
MSSRKTVLITGSSSGFGRLIAETLARKGYTVFATMRNVEGKNAVSAREIRELAKKESLDLQVLELDVTQDSSVECAVAEAARKSGRIDVAVNNAGYGVIGVTEAITSEQAQRIMDTNFLGAMRVYRAVLPWMRRQKSGLLLNISSGAGRLAIPGMAFYCASKSAMEAVAEAYRYELAPQGIDSVIVQPGAYPTAVFGNIEHAADTSRNDTYGEVAAIGDRVIDQLSRSTANPQDLADAVVQVIETPAGKRSVRYRVSAAGGLGVDEINAVCERVQQQVLQAFGLTDIVGFHRAC